MKRPELRIDFEYRNTNNWKLESDIFNKMFREFSDNKGIQNTGGFRFRSKIGSKTSIENAAFILLVTNFSEHEWPDYLDSESGVFTYYGDNRSSGNLLHNTHIGGNRLLKYIFEELHTQNRKVIPPFFVFESHKIKNYSFMKFIGLAVPGAESFTSLDDLVAVWRIKKDKRFQNYRSVFTILDEEIIAWEWLDDIVNNLESDKSKFCPESWRRWIRTGKISALQCKRDKIPRSKNEQIPTNAFQRNVLKKFHELSDREFEYAAKEIMLLMDSHFVNLEVTPKFKDRGHDVIGYYKLGHAGDTLLLNVHAEAKKWKMLSSIGVKPIARLISRIRHKQLGVFITTSTFDKQVQEELIEDKHPIILISGLDIVNILIKCEIAVKGNLTKLDNWLDGIKEQVETE